MKYYSEVLKKFYDDEKSLREEERKYQLVKKQEDDKLAKKKERAMEVEAAFKSAVEIEQKANKEINDAYVKFYNLRNKYIKDYGAWHYTYTSEKPIEKPLSLFDLFDELLKF